MRAALPQFYVSPWPLRGVIVSFLLAAALLPVSRAQSVSFAGATPSVNFGTANVCPSAKTTPAPCSKTLTLTYNVTASGSLATPQVLTLGAPNLDYTLASGSTCTGAVTQGNTCKVNVTFAPIAPGARNGAVEITNSSGAVLATTYIYGIGVGPRTSFNPAPVRTIVASNPEPMSYNPLNPIAVDGNGNIFVAEYNNANPSLIELLAVNGSVPENPVIKILASNFSYPVYAVSPLAVDGAGNVFYVTVEDFGVGSVYEMPAADGYATTVPIIGADFSGLAIDGSGNLFSYNAGALPIGPYGPGGLVEILAAGGYTTTKLLGGAAELYPVVMALDANGNLFVSVYSDSVNTGPVNTLEFTPADNYSTFRTINTNIAGPFAQSVIGLDPAGNLFISTEELDPSGNLFGSTEEYLAVDGVLPATPVSRALQQLLNVYPIALDSLGNLYYVNRDNGLQEVELSAPPALSFAATRVGHTISESVEVQNEGNATLDLTGLSVDSSNWDLISGSGTPADCTASSSLTSSALCNLTIRFQPTEAGSLTGAVTLTDNILNTPGTTQSILLTGRAASGPVIISPSANYGALYAEITLTGVFFGASQGTSIVTFNGVPAPVLSWSDTSITVTVPYRAVTGSVVVTVGGDASNAVPFTVEPYPTITGISPTSGAIGTLVTITGTNLLDAQGHGTVYMSDTQLPILSQSNTSLQVTIPTGAVSGVMNVHVNGVGLASPVFTVTGAPANPQITSPAAAYGALYAIISLTGTGFGAVQGSSTVTFNGIPAPVSTWTNTGITVTVPYRATTGNVVVTVAKTASNSIPFIVVPTPTVTGISPSSGPVGTPITISGDNFGYGFIWFGNINAPIISETNTRLVVEVPAGAVTGQIDVHIAGVGIYTPVFTVTP